MLTDKDSCREGHLIRIDDQDSSLRPVADVEQSIARRNLNIVRTSSQVQFGHGLPLLVDRKQFPLVDVEGIETLPLGVPG